MSYDDDEPDNLKLPHDSDSVDDPPQTDKRAAESADFDQCPHCRKFIWQGSVRCPRCGHYVVQESWLCTRRWVIVTAIVLLVVLVLATLLWYYCYVPSPWSLAP